MPPRSALQIAQDLIRVRTVNPPGNEAAAMRILGTLLEDAGFRVDTYEMSAGRTSIVATCPGMSEKLPLCFTGHLDTVPLGSKPWSFDPFSGDVAGGKLHGRGASDMKGGVGAIVSAAVRAAASPLRRGLKLVFTASEETGCQGAQHLAQSNALGAVSAIVVAEPTSNAPLIGHRGALWLSMKFSGRAAHGSTPEEGDSALKKAASAIGALHSRLFQAHHPWLGSASLNVGYCRGGESINIVPDAAELGLDIRTVPGQAADLIEQALASLTQATAITRIIDLAPVFTEPENRWLTTVGRAVTEVTGQDASFGTAGYFTDASVLAPNSGNPPVLILGPGDIAQAHRVDEVCDVARIEQATEIFLRIMRDDTDEHARER